MEPFFVPDSYKRLGALRSLIEIGKHISSKPLMPIRMVASGTKGVLIWFVELDVWHL